MGEQLDCLSCITQLIENWFLYPSLFSLSEQNFDKRSQLSTKRQFLQHDTVRALAMSGAPGLRGIAHGQKGSELSHWEIISFPLLQVTQSSSWPWLHGVRWEQFACSNGFRPGGLEQLTCTCTDTGLSITPGNGIEQSKEELCLAPWCYQQRLLGLVQPSTCDTGGKGDTCNHTERARGLEWAAQTCKETMLPFLKET